MTTYTKRDIRAADMLAMILIGFGLVLILFQVLPLMNAKPDVKVQMSPVVWILAGVFVLLGLALNLKVRQLVRNKGREPEDYPDVPE
ncbi:MAG: hypothetical protein KF830_06425 [Planctomycetes bacterium]|nr:hypothetical protein [Planctomycetota bacterium]